MVPECRPPLPPAEFYEDFDQLENGVGMWRLFEQEFWRSWTTPTGSMRGRSWTWSPVLWRPTSSQMMEELHRQYPMIQVTVHPIQNKFFGGNVSVAGLVTATDIPGAVQGASCKAIPWACLL